MQRPIEIETLIITRTRAPAADRARRQNVARARPAGVGAVPGGRGNVFACLIVAVVASVHLAGMPSKPRAVSRAPRSWLAGTTLLTVYGRSFGTAPILGRLGMDHNFADVTRQVHPYVRAIHRYQPTRRVRIAIHLIYGLATPCTSQTTCLLYLDDTGVNIIERYIKPAARRGWLVILDDQLGRSSPYSEIERMITRGYLRYDNVEVAFDPEFHAGTQQALPGVPPGYVTAGQLNLAQRTMSRYCVARRLRHRKLLLVHEWTAAMIRRRRQLDDRVPYVDPVLVMDAIGAPADKARVYDHLLGTNHESGLRWRGIKLFPSNPYEMAGHLDAPILSWRQLFGLARVGGVEPFYVSPSPNVIVMT